MSDILAPTKKDPSSLTYWRLVAISLDPDRTTPELYALVHEGEKDVPLMVDERVLLFTDRARARGLIQQYGSALIVDHIDVEEPFAWCDVAQALYHLSAGGIDDRAVVLDTVNVLLDFVAAIGSKFDERRKRALFAIADYCTFNKDLTKYLEEEGDYSSRELVDALLWCVGAIAVKSRIV